MEFREWQMVNKANASRVQTPYPLQVFKTRIGYSPINQNVIDCDSIEFIVDWSFIENRHLHTTKG